MNNIIVKIISDVYLIKCHNQYIECKARGKFRNINIHPLVGDYVNIDIDKKIITDVLKRKNELQRPPISNIDQALIVISVKDPVFSSNLLDKMLNIMEFHKIKPIICFSKLDLVNKTEYKEMKKYIHYYRKIGYKVLTNKNYWRLKLLLKNKITVVAGQSGVGKSTLINNLNKALTLKTNQISASLKRGTNTTRHVELLPIGNGLIADTPGFSALDFINMTKENIRDNMIEFNKYKSLCQYHNCFHINESKCGIKDAVNKKLIILSRYNNYKKFIDK